MNNFEKNLRKALKSEISASLQLHLEKAIEKGVINALKSLGLDADNLREVQQDFHYLRYSRKTKEKALSSLIGAITSAIIGSISIAVWEVIKILLQ